MILPFEDEIKLIRRLGVRHLLLQGLNFATVICTALMMWKALSIVTNSESPIVVVLRSVHRITPLGCLSDALEGLYRFRHILFILSGSMEPAIQVR
jgi:hypothetical protein